MPQHQATPASDISRVKDRLRTKFGDRRSALEQDDRRRQENETLGHLQSFAPYQRATTVALYAPVRAEFDTSIIAADLLARGVRTLYPRCLASFRLEFAPASQPDEDGWTSGAFGVPEPIADAVDPNCIDLIFVPLLAIDEQGNRLGYGAGYYDRWLARHPMLQALSVGIAYREQISPQPLPFEDNDITVNWLASADGIRQTIS